MVLMSDAEKEVQHFKKADFQLIFFIDFISVLLMFSVTYHLSDINEVGLPKAFRPCINSLKTEISTGDCGFFLKSAIHWKPTSAYKGMVSSFSSRFSKAATPWPY